jgi:hypothetical protein
MDILHFTLLFALVILSVSLTYCVWKKDLQQTTSIVKQKRRFTKQDKIVGALSLAFVFVLLTLQIIK